MYLEPVFTADFDVLLNERGQILLLGGFALFRLTAPEEGTVFSQVRKEKGKLYTDASGARLRGGGQLRQLGVQGRRRERMRALRSGWKPVRGNSTNPCWPGQARVQPASDSQCTLPLHATVMSAPVRGISSVYGPCALL